MLFRSLSLSYRLNKQAPWADAGFEVAWAQAVIFTEEEAKPTAATAREVEIVSEPDHSLVSFEDSSLVFDHVTGRLLHWQAAGLPLVEQGPRLCLWRAPTDNDNGGWQGSAGNRWREAQLHLLQHRVRSVQWTTTRTPTLRVETRVAAPVKAHGYDCLYQYVFHRDGAFTLTVEGQPFGSLPDPLPRIGLELELPGDLSQASWYGYGPGEAYADTRQAVRLGRWSMPVSDLDFPYVRPQETGNRVDARRLILSRPDGGGLRMIGRPVFDFSAHRYPTDAIVRARHTKDLEPEERIWLHLDLQQHGIGHAACGQPPLPQYSLHPVPFTFSLRFESLSPIDLG